MFKLIILPNTKSSNKEIGLDRFPVTACFSKPEADLQR